MTTIEINNYVKTDKGQENFETDRQHHADVWTDKLEKLGFDDVLGDEMMELIEAYITDPSVSHEDATKLLDMLDADGDGDIDADDKASGKPKGELIAGMLQHMMDTSDIIQDEISVADYGNIMGAAAHGSQKVKPK